MRALILYILSSTFQKVASFHLTPWYVQPLSVTDLCNPA